MSAKYNVPSYERRLAKIQSIHDLDSQIQRAKRYMMRMRTMKKAAGALTDKLQADKALKLSESVLHKLRVNYFAIEDSIKAKSRFVPGQRVKDLESGKAATIVRATENDCTIEWDDYVSPALSICSRSLDEITFID